MPTSFSFLKEAKKKKEYQLFVTHRQRHIEFIVRAQSIEAKKKKLLRGKKKRSKERRKAIGSRRRPRRKEILKIRGEEENVVEEDTAVETERSRAQKKKGRTLNT